MAKMKPVPICSFEGCTKKRRTTGKGNGKWNRFCSTHGTKATMSGFLGNLYSKMNQRVQGRCTSNPHLYVGLPILPKDVFMTWAKNHPDFLNLYKQWFSSGFDIRLTPSINRMNSKNGYLLNNIEWMTFAQNSGLAAGVRKAKQKKAIYDLLGVNK
jgi:hypothetical protein